MCANLNIRSFNLNFRYMATSKQADIHTHVRNAVTLVWGSLRLAPMRISSSSRLVPLMELVTVSLCLEQSMEPHARSQWILAAISLLLGQTFSRMLDQSLLQPVHSYIQTVTGEQAPIHRKAQFQLGIGPLVLPQKLWVADIQDQCILGLEFLYPNGCQVNLRDQLLTIGEDRPSSLTKYARLCWYGKSVCHPG